MSLIVPLLLIGLCLVMALAWAVQRLTGRSGWIDVIWTLGVGAAGLAAAALADGAWERRLAAIVLIVLWSLRLGAHIASRSGVADDPRYARLIEDWGAAAAWRLFVFLQTQALAAFVLALAVLAAASNPAPFPGVLDLVGLAVAVVAIAGEGIADAQLARFRKSPQAPSEICEAGLWAYTRHPNYFFEWLFWCAWPLLALTASPWSWASLMAPAMMYWLLVHVSGVPPLEAHMLRSRGEAFADLQRRVNAFFPGPRRDGPR